MEYRGQREHRAQFAEREHGDEGQRIHAADVRLAVGDVHGAPQDARAQRGQNAQQGAARSRGGLMRCGEGQQARAHHHGQRSAQHLGPLPAPGAAQFVEQQPAPEQSHQAVGVPQGKSDGEAHIADGEHRQSVGHRPQHPGQHGPHDQVSLLAKIQQNVARAFQQGRHGPARHEHARHHPQRDDERRKSHGDELGGRLGQSEPRSGAQPAGHAERVQGTARELRGGSGGCVHGSPDQRQQGDAEKQDRYGRPKMPVGEDGSNHRRLQAMPPPEECV